MHMMMIMKCHIKGQLNKEAAEMARFGLSPSYHSYIRYLFRASLNMNPFMSVYSLVKVL